MGMIGRRLTLLAFGILVAMPARAFADEMAADKPDPAEAKFVSTAARNLQARFPTTDAAIKAGYLRFTDEDDTGAISYADRHWTSADAAHPSQLWYDAGGRLIGADYSEPYAAGVPHRFGVAPSRWQTFPLHVHYGIADSNGKTVYGATGPKKLAAIGASAARPTAADLVKLGLAKSPEDVRFVFTFPAIYDLALWLVPNPNGAFADKNPNVKPRHTAGAMGM